MHSGILLALCIAVLQVVYTSQSKTTLTHGASGVECAETQCLAGVPCINGRCKCQNGGHGNGAFACAEPEEEICFFNNDPFLHTYGGSRVEIPIMNKVLMSHISTKRCPRRHDHGASVECDTRVFAWGHRRKGKMFIQGLEVKVFLAKGWLLYHHAVRVKANITEDGDWEFIEEGNHNFLGNPPYGQPVRTHIMHGGTIRTVYDHTDNFAEVFVDDCGVHAAIRGFDFSGQMHWKNTTLQEPGVFIKVKKECKPEFLSPGHSMCSSPDTNLELQKEQMNKLLDREFSVHNMMVIKSLQSDAFQDHPEAPIILWSLAETAAECEASLLVDAVTNCTFMFDNAHFHRCYDSEDDSDVKMLALYNNCLFSICDTNTHMCQFVQQEIEKTHCRPTSTGPTILDHACDF